MALDVRTLRERKLFQWMLAYAGAAWLVLQFFDAVAEPLAWSTAAFFLMVTILAAGLPFVLVLAWYHGEKGRQRVSGPELVMIGALLAIAGTAFSFRPGPAAAGPDEVAGTAGGSALDTLDPRSVAVLPFANVSTDEGDAYFADGIHEELITRLSRISTLRVISRTSVMQYRGAEQNVREIARDLGVGTVLEGSVRRAGERLRVTAQLIDARSDAHLWAETYDRVLSAGNVFAIQTEIADRVAASLEASLTPAERSRLEERPTDNLQAYEFLLRGSAVAHQGFTEERIRLAIAMYEQAVELDPAFGIAHARLAREHDNMIWFGYDRSEDRERQVSAALDRARTVAPEQYETEVAAAFYLYHRGRYAEAVDRFRRAEEIRPNQPEALAGMAFVRRRQGDLREAVGLLKRALERDPHLPSLPWNIGETLLLLRDCDGAETYLERTIALSPEWPRPHAFLALSRVLCSGDPLRARATLDMAFRTVPNPQRDPFLNLFAVQVELLAGDYDRALERIGRISSSVIEGQFWYIPKSYMEGEVHALAGRPAVARDRFMAAAAVLESAVREDPDDERVRGSLGLTYAHLGRVDDAIREGRRGVELMPMKVDAYKSTLRQEDLARILVLAGQHETALELIRTLLDHPALFTPHVLRLDPRFDAVRDHPGFRELAARAVAPSM